MSLNQEKSAESGSFKQLGLIAELLRTIEEEGYTEPTPVQKRVIPLILEGADLLAGAQTGTGKTAGFTLPMLQRLLAKKEARGIRALILTPTRELASQVQESVKTYGRHLPFRSAVVFGGVNMNMQIKQLRNGVDILIATPGRLLDHVSRRTVDLSKVEMLVLDEADQMLDMGFINDIKQILSMLPNERQSLLFSATFSEGIKNLAHKFLKNPKLVQVAGQNSIAEGVTHVVHPVDNRRKKQLLSFLIKSEQWKQVLVFTRTKHGANCLTEHLEEEGIRAVAIHGNKAQGARMKALADFKRGGVQVLVATDVASRGLDIDQLPYVVNYELPNVPESYVHRIGRTGRAGCKGTAVSLVCVDERDYLRNIERMLKQTLSKVVIAGYEPDPSIPAQPIFNGRRFGGGGNSNRNRKPFRSDSRGPASSGDRRPRGGHGGGFGGHGNRGSNRGPRRSGFSG